MCCTAVYGTTYSPIITESSQTTLCMNSLSERITHIYAVKGVTIKKHYHIIRQ